MELLHDTHVSTFIYVDQKSKMATTIGQSYNIVIQ